jgi:hypothetical protein
MTPTPQPSNQFADSSPLSLNLSGDLHLTDDQMSELLDPATALATGSAHLEAAEAHLPTCAACSAELASLREALSLFQQASIAHADQEFARLPSQDTADRPAYSLRPAHRPYSQTLFWLAASAVLVAGILPLQMRWQRNPSTPPATTSAPAHTTESDEALLEDINRELSTSVPAPMQALADPTGTASADTQTSIQTSTQTSTQRKD